MSEILGVDPLEMIGSSITLSCLRDCSICKFDPCGLYLTAPTPLVKVEWPEDITEVAVL
jgi:hypothetical protein